LTYKVSESSDKFYDPKGRQYDQMTQAARSGRQNIIEGSERSATSKDTEMKLTDVARASLSELRGDFEVWILDRNQVPWSARSEVAKAVNAVSLDRPAFAGDMVHESAKYALTQREKYARWLDSEDATVVANTMLILIGRAMNMLSRQIQAQGRAFEENGGFSERLMAKRLEARDQQRLPGPVCPECGESMRRRRSAKGEFWGYSGFPDCRGTRPLAE
jgi:restriction system protein